MNKLLSPKILAFMGGISLIIGRVTGDLLAAIFDLIALITLSLAVVAYFKNKKQNSN
ncbi:MAG: hypothetical protein UT66_C0013G0006 [candidate division CPR2 bacterium GW2011_GWC1_39_9]|uniref:Uncharacterized protein n=1 Tax=candidate division CPR2 bacterium GW2011_GWC2_39_10 TaxID=1618345 RepID=A0A0G0LT25_UNCC2|nr:MAG: hypothetical protein UT18_C0012G0034 [candidate division CPR2 bacterium GW2011_GWC2_39_10]KKR35034.1 MAG: hypothetical protein UT66_C0013G0006 [candidate division CPR2 bacterium GW2011_GWC1_39_9]